MEMEWEILNPRFSYDMLGFLPSFIRTEDGRPIKEQIDDNYRHGGGWFSMNPERWSLNRDTMGLKYPGDPVMKPHAKGQLRDETIYFYDHAIILVMQKDGSFDLCRVD